jgi:hypothetical protein
MSHLLCCVTIFLPSVQPSGGCGLLRKVQGRLLTGVDNLAVQSFDDRQRRAGRRRCPTQYDTS